MKKVPCVPNREEYSGFMAALSLECECVKKAKGQKAPAKLPDQESQETGAA